MWASQEVHDPIVKESFLIQVLGGHYWVIGIGLVILGKVLLNVVRKVTGLGTPHFVLGGRECLVDRAEQQGRQDSNDADDAQQFNQGEPGSGAMVWFHSGLDRA